MPDEVTPETPAQAQGAADAAKSTDGPKYVTADDLKAFADSVAANTRRMLEGYKAKNEKAPAKADSPPPSVDVHSVIRREQEISESLLEQSHLTKEQRTILRKLVDVEKPEDVAGFIAGHAKAFGRPSGDAQPTNMKPPAQTGRPVSDVPAPSAPPRFTEDTPLVQLSPEDRARLVRDKGVHWYRETLRRQAKGLRVRLR